MMTNIMINIIESSLYISTAIILITLLKEKVLNKYTYKLNYMICILITLKMIFIFDMNIYIPFELVKKSNDSNIVSLSSIIQNNKYTVDYMNIFFIVWIIGVIYLITKNIYKMIVFYKKIENITYEIDDEQINTVLADEKIYLNIRRNIKVLKVDGLSSPALIGIFNSKIIIPNRHYSEKELSWIFRHELNHFKRKDNFFKLLLNIGSSIHWFNPLISKFKAYLEEQCELSCDEIVLNRSKIEESKEYALILLNTLKYRNSLKTSSFASALNTTSQVDIIKNRIDEILSNKKRKKGGYIATALIISVLISMTSFKANAYTNEENIIIEYINNADLKEEFEKNGEVTIEKDGFISVYKKVNLDR